MKLIHVVGARPQFVKLAPFCRVIKEHNSFASKDIIKSVIVHTGQHYDYLMSKVFFDDLMIPEPDYNLEVGSERHGRQTGLMLERIEDVLIHEGPDMVVVYGDTNSTLAGALAASKLHIPIAHIEAGLRSYNRRMPEEINRLLTDHMSSILFCPTKTSVINLKKEGFVHILKDGALLNAQDEVFIPDDPGPIVANVGDIMYDSVLFSLQKAIEKSNILNTLNLYTDPNGSIPYVLCTIHRQENTNDQQRLKIILSVLDEIAMKKMQVIFPVHPRTRGILEVLDHRFSHLKIIDPVSYYDMLILIKHAKIVMTDSGGVQKETFFMQVPCITLRDETEWTETVDAGMNIVTGIDKKRIWDTFQRFIQAPPVTHQSESSPKPFGNADSSRLILKIILSQSAAVRFTYDHA